MFDFFFLRSEVKADKSGTTHATEIKILFPWAINKRNCISEACRETEISIVFLEIMTFGSTGNDHYRINKLRYIKNFFRGNKLYSNPNTFY